MFNATEIEDIFFQANMLYMQCRGKLRYGQALFDTDLTRHLSDSEIYYETDGKVAIEKFLDKYLKG